MSKTPDRSGVVDANIRDKSCARILKKWVHLDKHPTSSCPYLGEIKLDSQPHTFLNRLKTIQKQKLR